MAGTSAQQLLEHEKRRQRDLVAKTQQEVAKTNLKPSSNYKMQAKLQQPRSSPKVESSASAASLEYSADGSTIFADQATAFTAETSLLGQQFATDGSVSTAGRPKLSTVRDSQDEDEDDDYSSAALSLQTSTSSAVSVVPTDEELFAAGWAKALDPKSGNYYYFTLDRTTTMWENPLTQSQPVDAPGA